MNKSSIKKIVWDLDNTPWDWVGAAAHIYPAMHHCLVRETGLSRERIRECMQHFYGRAGTLECSWLVQDLERQGLFEGLELDRGRLIRQVRRAFHMNRQKHLTLFEGFPEVLLRARDNGIENLIRTDAPACHAASRLRHFQLNDRAYFSGMMAMQDSLPDEVPSEFHARYLNGSYGLPFPVTLTDTEKPDGDLTGFLNMTESEIGRHVAFVGDNYAKDMGQAARYGSMGIYAKWGRASQTYLETLAEYSAGDVASRNAQTRQATTTFENILQAEHPRQISELLGWQ